VVGLIDVDLISRYRHDMRQKVSTILDDHLFRRAKLESVRQGKNISQVLGEALERYLTEAGGRRATAGVVAEGWGVLKLDRRTVKRLATEEEGLFDA
jgi:hypothetical protein